MRVTPSTLRYHFPLESGKRFFQRKRARERREKRESSLWKKVFRHDRDPERSPPPRYFVLVLRVESLWSFVVSRREARSFEEVEVATGRATLRSHRACSRVISLGFFPSSSILGKVRFFFCSLLKYARGCRGRGERLSSHESKHKRNTKNVRPSRTCTLVEKVDFDLKCARLIRASLQMARGVHSETRSTNERVGMCPT